MHLHSEVVSALVFYGEAWCSECNQSRPDVEMGILAIYESGQAEAVRNGAVCQKDKYGQ